MKALKYIGLLSCIAIITIAFASCSSDASKKQTENNTKYTCSMHPQIVEDHPGTCPICAMDLVKMSTQTKNGLTLSDSQIKLGNIKTITVGEGNYGNSRLLNAKLITNPLNHEVIASKFMGRVDKLFIKEAGQQINRGQVLYQIYSEDLLALQKDYLLNLRQQSVFPNENIYKRLTEASKNKLLLYGYSQNQISKLRSGSETNPYIMVYAPINGLVTEINITEGQYVSEGMSVLKIENLENLWVEADIYPSEIGDIKVGSSVKVNVSGFENETLNSKIEFINPQLDAGNQILKVRASIDNKNNQYQPGMQVNVSFPFINKNKVISLPNDAVIRDGKGSHIWIKTGDKFDWRMVEIGNTNEKTTVINKGIENGEQVVISGAYLLTSEYILKKGGDL